MLVLQTRSRPVQQFGISMNPTHLKDSQLTENQVNSEFTDPLLRSQRRSSYKFMAIFLTMCNVEAAVFTSGQ